MSSEPELQQIITEHVQASLVTRYVIVAECIASDGSPYLAELKSPGLSYWDVIGMCTAAADGHRPQPSWTLGVNNEN